MSMPVPVPIAPTAGGLPTPLIDCSEPLFISATAVTPAVNGTHLTWAGMVFLSDGSLTMMLSELATVPVDSEITKFGSGPPEEPPRPRLRPSDRPTMTTTAAAMMA